MSSVLNSPMVDSMTALSRASPTVPIDGAMPASTRASVKLTAVYWLPASEWNTRPLAVKATLWRRRVNRACSSAAMTSGVVFDVDTRQPRIRREHTSVTKLTYTNPARVHTCERSLEVAFGDHVNSRWVVGVLLA